MKAYDLTKEEKDKIKQEIREKFDELELAGDEEITEILAISKPLCKDCFFFHHTYEGYGDCRFNAPPWVQIDKFHWCGKWWSPTITRVESAFRRQYFLNKI